MFTLNLLDQTVASVLVIIISILSYTVCHGMKPDNVPCQFLWLAQQLLFFQILKIHHRQLHHQHRKEAATTKCSIQRTAMKKLMSLVGKNSVIEDMKNRWREILKGWAKRGDINTEVMNAWREEWELEAGGRNA